MHLLVKPIIVLLSVIGATSRAQDSQNDSPQAVFESYKAALGKNDWRSLYSTFSPGYRDFMIFECVFAMGMNAPNVETERIMSKYVDQAKLKQLHAQHKQQPAIEETHKMLSRAIQNKREMYFDCMKYFHTTHKNDPAKKQKYGPLLGLVINKNVATAKSSVTSTVVSYSRAADDSKDIRREQEVTREKSIYFIKVDGKWLYATLKEWQSHNDTGK